MNNEWHAVLRLDEDDEVVAQVREFAEAESIDAAWLSAIGSSKEVELGYYDLAKKEYFNKTFTEELEVLDATGTLGQLDGEPALHLHGTFGDKDYHTIGGHIHKLVSNATVEVFIHKMSGRLERQPDEATGLKLLR